MSKKNPAAPVADTRLEAIVRLDFTPAAPAQPEEPQWDLTPHVVRLRGDDPEWRKLTREQREALIDSEGRKLTRALGRPMTMVEWDALKPDGCPAASGVAKVYSPDGSWQTLAASWLQS